MSQPEDNKTENPKKKLSKTTKIVILVVGWLILVGVGIGAAFLLKPAPEIVHTDAVVEAYKFSEPDTEKTIETVDDLNYYGYYTPNPIAFNPRSDIGHSRIYAISGLKDKSVEEKINAQIEEAISDFSNSGMRITTNYYNILSFYLTRYDYEAKTHQYKYYTFDLNTGNQLSFDDLFSAGVNLISLLYKSFYDGLSAGISFKILDAERKLSYESTVPDPSQCLVMFCPLPGETYDSIREQLANYNDQLANIEEITMNYLQSYLSGEKKFYLNSYGPAFILADGRAMKMELGDDIRYAVYLKHYRTSDSIYDGSVSVESNPFFTEISTPNSEFFSEETDSFLFDYLDETNTEAISLKMRQSYRQHVKNKGLSIPGDSSKFRHILATGQIYERDNIRQSQLDICVYETDKSYYDSVYRKAVIDGKTQEAAIGTQQPPRTGRFDSDRVVQLPINGKNGCLYYHPLVTQSGELIEDVDKILINPSDSELGWKDYLKQTAYSKVCYQSSGQKCYSDEEKQSQELSFAINGSGGIRVDLKDDSESGSTYLTYVDFGSIPRQYINPDILVNASQN